MFKLITVLGLVLTTFSVNAATPAWVNSDDMIVECEMVTPETLQDVREKLEMEVSFNDVFDKTITGAEVLENQTYELELEELSVGQSNDVGFKEHLENGLLCIGAVTKG